MVLLAGFQSAHAQRLFTIFVNPMYNAPSGDKFSGAYNAGFGIEGGAGIGWGRTFLTGTLGYNWFNATGKYKNFGLPGTKPGNLTATPIKVGIRQYLFGRMLYAKVDGGVAFTNNKHDKGSKFIADAGVGVKLAGFNLGIDVNTLNFGLGEPYTSGKWVNWVSFKAGWSFGL
ncbi:hypothetical protein DXN05_09075 [Deminuibacter soli]|uniref:Outer membrane protein beta-barrel domain-containing protein n=2 Tax=Deminuibacter soli TaxID=2291815 RepID=A0A3E1NLU8_9BACT|nr:hypothetical protein DXN05_09075 [Deminuibacter soli]